MKKLFRRHHTLIEDHQNSSKFPFINEHEFRNKLNDILSKVDIQNRYTQRVSQSNIKNMEALEQARQELQEIADKKKQEELKASDEKQLIDMMTRKVRESEEELTSIFKELLDAKREVRRLKKQVTELERETFEAEKQLLQERRQRIEQIKGAKQQMASRLLQNQINEYLLRSQKTQTLLYKFSLDQFKASNFDSFFERLDQKIEESIRLQGRKQSRATGASQSSLHKLGRLSSLALKQPTFDSHGLINGTKAVSHWKLGRRNSSRRVVRYKTEHHINAQHPSPVQQQKSS